MKLRRSGLAGFFAATALLAFACSDIRPAGPSTEQGNPQIVAFVIDGLGHAVRGASVSVYITPMNADSTEQPSAAQKIALAATDALGKCSFEHLIAGTYSLDAVDSGSGISALKTNIAIAGTVAPRPDFTDTLVLALPGSMHGVVTRGRPPSNQLLRNGFIQVKIKEIDRFTTTGPDGKYSFINLPGGVYTLFYYAADGYFTAKRENIAVTSGKDTLLDTVKLTPIVQLLAPAGFRADYDSTAGIVRLSWQKVDYTYLRWYEVERIDIAGPYDKVFTTIDTAMVDSLMAIPAGTTLDYVVRSVDNAFNRSLNAGPVEITVKARR